MEKPDLSGAEFQTFLRPNHADLDKDKPLYFQTWVCPLPPKPGIHLKEASLIKEGILPETQLG